MDASSLSNPTKYRIKHLYWKVNVDFEVKKLSCEAIYDIELLGDAPSSRIVLDTSSLIIRKIATNSGQELAYKLGEVDSNKRHLGAPLDIQLDEEILPNNNRKAVIHIIYETTATCSAAQWLPPAQTAGKVHPYLFTQCFAIHARSLVPCQDCPGVKMTYSASVIVPAWATCLMSAVSKGCVINANETKTFTFDQRVPISSYLLAMAVGEISGIDISPRCKIYSEPSLVKAAAYEFAQTEEFLQIAEDLTFEYQWGRYDVLCLPPSFPYGGMENPCITFVTPTLLAGDRSLADVVAHEISHSWTGNLVTNATWDHFWLNEGWTMWLERKIMARIANDDRVVDFSAISGWKDLQDDIDLQDDDHTKLVLNLGDCDPDDAYSSVPYEKGFNLLYALEKKVGKENFETFAKAYLKEYKFCNLTSEEFKKFFQTYFDGEKSIAEFDWDEWLYSPGLPENPKFDHSLSDTALALSKAWIEYDNGAHIVPLVDIKEWSTNMKTCFLDKVLQICKDRNYPLSISTINAMEAQYKMSSSRNCEILLRWCELCIEAKDEGILLAVAQFITSQGRMKYIRPLYRSLFQWKGDLAVDLFVTNREFYHPIASKMLASDLQIDKANKRKRIFKMLSGIGLVFGVVGVSFLFISRNKKK